MWKYCWIKYTTYNIYNKWETNTENSIEKFDKIETKKENKGHRRSFWAKVKKDIELVESFKHEEKFQILHESALCSTFFESYSEDFISGVCLHFTEENSIKFLKQHTINLN